MGTITRKWGSEITITYNANALDSSDIDTFKYGITSFGFLVPRNQTISLSDFIEMIRRCYDPSPQVKAVLKCIEKAKITAQTDTEV